MINPIMLEILKRQLENGTVKVEDIKDEDYKNAIMAGE